MDINLDLNGNSNQVGNLKVLIGSDPFLPKPDSPTVEPNVITVDENLNTPPPPSVTPEYSQESLTKPLHPYFEADICLDTESKQILQTPLSPLDKDPSLTDLGPIDPDIFASPPPGMRDLRKSLVPYTVVISLMTPMMSILLIWAIINSKGEERTFPVDNHIPMDGRGVTEAFLMDNTPVKLFFKSGASRSYLSKKFYDANKSLHKLPKFVMTCTGIKIGNGSIIPTLFVIPIQFMTNGHIFEIYTIVAGIDDGMDPVFWFRNMTETERMLNTGDYDFIGRSIPVYPQNYLDVLVGKQVLIKIKAPFDENLSGRIMTKLFGSEKVFTMKLGIENNQGCVQFISKGKDIAKLRKDKAIGVLDLRSGYFKVNYQKMITMANLDKLLKCTIINKSEKNLKNILMNTLECQIQTQRKNTPNLLIVPKVVLTNTLG